MKRQGTRIKSVAAGAALLLASIAGPVSGETGSCIYSGDTNRTCTAVARIVQDVDFFGSAAACVDDVPFDSFASIEETNVLQKFRSDAPRGLSILIR